MTCLFVIHICLFFAIQQSMKLKEVLQESMLVVGCIVGVSFVTGKEAQTFVGNGGNIVLFCIVFALSTLIVQLFCARNNLQSTQQFVQFAFKNWGYVVYFALLVCFFVCLVTTLATVQSCFAELISKTPFAIWSAIVALASALLLKWGKGGFKVVSLAAFVGAFVTFLFVSAQGNGPSQRDVAPLSTILYSLFSLTMVLPICCKTRPICVRQRLLCVVIATVIVALLLWWVEGVADFTLQLPIGGRLQGVGKVCLCLTVALCGISGVVANTLPICEGLEDIIGDKKLLKFVVLALAWAFSCFGLDILLKYGYLFVAVVGFGIVVRCIFGQKNSTTKAVELSNAKISN